MPKVKYDDITFDSDLEVEYYKKLIQDQKDGLVLEFIYHPEHIQNLVGKRNYTPDYLVLYPDRIEIIELKGYNPYSKTIDDQIHNVMLSKSERWLASYVLGIINSQYGTLYKVYEWQVNAARENVVYKKLKYLKAYGFVDWDFKKEAERYFRYHLKIVNNEKLTKPQKEWYYNYTKKLREEWYYNYTKKLREEYGNETN